MQIDMGQGHILHTSDEWRTPDRQPQSSHMSLRHAGALSGERAVSEFIGHHTGGATLGHNDPAQWIRNIYDYHVHGRRYSDIAYETAIDDDGNLWELRDNAFTGAHTLANPPDGVNHNRIGHAAVFLRMNRGFTDRAKVGYRKCLGLVAVAAQARPHTLVHNDVSMTACPGSDIAAFFHSGELADPSPAPNLTPLPGHVAPAPPVVAHGYPGHLLRRGSRGSEVADVQRRLNDRGFGPLATDGAFGPMTENAVRRFQSARHLAVDGVVGNHTWGALWA